MSDSLRNLERELGDRYQIVRALGSGAFGAVYLARERQLHRLVAIKLLHADRADSTEERERLLREARTLANLSHPAIVPLLAYGETASTVYMVMPYVGGETLAARMEREGRLDPREARRILIEIADALAYAHGEGVLHRDLKPENVLLERAGAVSDDVPPRVRLIDFGVAAFHMRDPGVNPRVETWGTPAFMAPEQALGETELDPRSEIFSLGVIGFYMLGGRLPFDAKSVTERLVQYRQGPGTPLVVCAPAAPRDLTSAVTRCLAYEPGQRWARARDLRDALLRGAAAPEGALETISLVRQRLRARRGLLAPPPARPAPPVAVTAGTAPMDRARAAASGLLTDARFGVRTLRKAPGFTAAVVLTLAIGLSATTVIFSALEAIVLRKPAVAAPDRMVVLQEQRRGPNQSTSMGASTFRYDRALAYQGATRSVFTGLAGQSYESFSARIGSDTRAIDGFATTGNYFEVLGIRPALGRFYTATEDRPGGAEPVVVLDYDFWQRAYGGDPSVIGRAIHIDSRPMTVIGVTPPDFRGAFASFFVPDVWVPAAAYQLPPPAASDSVRKGGPRLVWMNLFARLRPGVEPGAATAALRTIAPRVPTENPDTRIADAYLEPMTVLPAELKKPIAGFMQMLLGITGLVLLIAATNAAGMLLARAAGRRREIATRLAVGASRRQLVRQLLVESVLLCLAAGALGLLLAYWVTGLLNAWQPPLPIRVRADFGLNGLVVGVAAVTVLGTALLAGLAPAVHATSMDLSAAMKAGGLQSGGPRRTRLRGAFVVAQVALSVVLLGVAGLFVRALQATLAVDPGFRAEGVVRAGIGLGANGYDVARAKAFFTLLQERLRARPEVAGVSVAGAAPLTGNTQSWGTRRVDQPDEPEKSLQWSVADVGFIELLKTPVLAGRTFTAADAEGAPLAAVLNETAVRQLWPDRAPGEVVGQEITSYDQRMTVVGVIGDGKYSLLYERPRRFGYMAFAQNLRKFGSGPQLFLRARGGTADALRAAREEVARIDPNVALERPALLADDVGKFVLPQRVGALLVGTFGLVGLVLAATGLYGVLAFGVAQRLREFGVRIALGARGRDVARLVVRSALALVAAGVVVGLVGTLAAGRVVRTIIFGTPAASPGIMAAVVALLGAVTLAATLVPARRAAAADPMTSLRAE
ncbi:MAG: ADOP family duplicated permease [Gemmatimonadaceae bacterium]